MKQTLNMRQQLAINLKYCYSARRATQNMPSSCIEPRIQVLHWALHLLGPALLCAYPKDETPKSCCKVSRHRSNGLCFHDFVI